MMGHLGSKVTVLLDGRLDAAEEERAWEHVHGCHGCRDAVEREGWVKTHLAQWGSVAAPSSESLRATLLAGPFPPAGPVGSGPVGAGAARQHAAWTEQHSGHRTRHAVAWGGSALGVAVMGLVALGAAPANTPFQERRTVTSIVPVVATSPSPSPARTAVQGPVSPAQVSSSTVPVRLGRPDGTMVP